MLPLSTIKKVAGHFKQYNPEIEYDDLFQEAALAFLKAQRTFDPTKNDSPIRWAYTQMKWAIMNYREKEQKYLVAEPVEEMTSPSNPESIAILKEEIKELSKEAQQVIQLVISSPSEYAGTLPQDARGKIRKNLKKQGWEHVQWAHVWKELKIVFS